MLGEVYQRAREFDIIHCHTDYLGLPLTCYTATPTLITLHGRLDLPDIAPLYYDYPKVSLVSISGAQRAPMPNANWVATLYHGLPADLYRFEPKPGSYLLFLGRIWPRNAQMRRSAPRVGPGSRCASPPRSIRSIAPTSST